MHSSGYDAAHFPPAGGGGGGGGPVFDRQAKPRMGCNSIALRATPVCPWKKSQNATPTTRALAQTLEALRATLICFRLVAVAPFVQSGDGASAIIVREPLRKDEVVVRVVLEASERDTGDDGEDPPFQREPPAGRKVGRTGQARQVGDRGRPCPQEKRPVLQRLDVPALDATGKCGRKTEVMAMEGSGDPRRDGRAGSDEDHDGDSFTRAQHLSASSQTS
jgi:hypothetical protein